MKILIKIGTFIGMLIIAGYVIGIIVGACINIVVGLFTAVFGGCVLLACWAIYQSLTERIGETKTPTPTSEKHP